jgi:hypothetical protein
MNIASAYSSKESINAAVQDLQAQLKNLDASMLIYFASSAYAPGIISQKMQEAFPDATVFGCSTAGEIASGKMLKNSVVAMAFNRQAIKDVRVEVIEDLNKDSRSSFNALERYFNKPMAEMDPAQYVGILLIDGMSVKEELIIDKICNLTNINFIGGSAGDDLKFSATHVYANGKSYRNAAVLAIMEPATKFSFIKTQSFRVLPQKLVVTKANLANREVLEFNDMPAAATYAKALGVSIEDATGRFMHNPVGLVIDGEPFVRSPQQIKDGSMIFYCGVVEGSKLSILESTDIIEDTWMALNEVEVKLGTISGIVIFNCILRTLELEQKHVTDKYGRLFAEIPTIGFSTYGEQYIGHINQTATMLVFK